ncbi:hypothetical protein ID866_1184 [Astraeus odoratus]|nr:hypothetical protein ID866_1184 [Astraeus odoratus]
MDTIDNTAEDMAQSTAQSIKRSTFVYGKRPRDEQRDIASAPADTGSVTRQRRTLHETEDGAGNPEPSPEALRALRRSPSAASDDESDSPGAPSHFQFNFRRQMKELDERFDGDDGHVTQPLHPKSLPPSPPPAEIAEPSPKDAQSGVHADDIAPLPRDTDLTSGDPFSGSSSPPVSPLSRPERDSLDDSPVIPRRTRGRVQRLPTSDSEPDPSSNSSSVSPIRYSINTPCLRSPPTPPSSEFDMTTTKKSGKAKGKAPVRDVIPIQFSTEEPTMSRTDNKGKRKESSMRPKRKAPTKKEKRETALEASRLANTRHVEVVRTTQVKYTIASLLATVQHAKPSSRARSKDPALVPELPSDPIEKFSSPTNTTIEASFGKPSSLLAAPCLESIPQASGLASDKMLAAVAESSDEEMPGIGHIVQQAQERREAGDQRLSLQEKKFILVQSRAAGPSSVADEDDDLEIVQDDMHLLAREEAVKRKADKTKQSPMKKKVLTMAIGQKGAAKASSGRPKLGTPPTLSEQHLKQFAKPAFNRSSKDDKETLTKQQLDRMMLGQHEETRLKMDKQKQQQWVEKGGRLIQEDSNHGQTSLSQTLATYAEQALKATEERDDAVGMHEASTEESDEDYAPELRGSASPEPADVKGERSDSAQETGVSDAGEQVTDEDDENTAPLGRKSGSRRVARVVLGSDDEDSEQPRQQIMSSPSNMGGQGVPGHRSTSSLDSQTEDENDKENNTKLMFDRSEDKENKAVVRHSPLSTRSLTGSGPLFRSEGSIQCNSPTVSLSNPGHIVTSPKEIVRSPLKELPRGEDDPFLFSPSAPKLPFTERLLRSRPSTPPRASPSSKQDLGSPTSLRSERIRRSTQSQCSFEGGNDENDAPAFKPLVLLPSFMETNQKRSPEPSVAPFNPANRGLSQFFSDDDTVPQNLGGNGLSLTLDVGLQPALEVSSTLLRKADMVFEKEQEYIVAAAQKDHRPKEVLYVNDHGSLTNTQLPDPDPPRRGKSANLSNDTFAGHKVHGHSTTHDSPEPQPLKRLRRRSPSPLDRVPGRDSSTSLAPPSATAGPSRINAFDVLGKVPKLPAAPKQKLKNSEFVAAEAEESDEDDMFGFGAPEKGNDEEDDDEDQDKILQDLVDDAAMDVETERPDLVQEKFREHEAEDDQKLENFHQEVVEGKHRKKRLGRGVNLDDDSDEDDDDENRRIRQRMYKKRKIESDDLEVLGQNEETRAFYNAYHHDLVDDGDDEFKHLQDVPMDDSDDEREQVESVTVDEVRERLRESARNQTVGRICQRLRVTLH